jgi:hypothetical protein
MVSRRTARTVHATPSASRESRRSRLGRTLPALALGVTALALAVPTTLPATASPGGPASGSTQAKSGTSSTAGAKKSSGTHLTAAAQKAGLEVGNATMGWRERGTERTVLREQGRGLLRYGAAASRSTTNPFVPDGVLGVDISSYQGNLKWSTWTKKDRDFAYM